MIEDIKTHINIQWYIEKIRKAKTLKEKMRLREECNITFYTFVI